MATILVIDDEAVVREPISASLRAHGHQVTCAGDGPTAMKSLQANVPDLILLDLRMPTMDGLAVLRELRAAPATAAVPVLLLSAVTDKALVLQVAKLNIQGYILKSAFSLDELLERVRRITSPPPVPDASDPAGAGPPAGKTARNQPAATAAARPAGTSPLTPAAPDTASWPRLLTREDSLARLDLVAGGKTVAGVVAQLLSVVNSRDADLADVVRVIQSDPILATRVLQLANAASTGSRGRVRTVEDAARNLGVRGIQNMAISIGIFGAFPPDESDGFNTMRCWQHSYAVADLLNVLLRERDPQQESMNHLIGLCHDLGEILLRQHFAAEYAQIVSFALAHGLPIHAVESVALGIRHPELISRLLTRIGLPSPAVQAIREFYEREIREQAAGLSVETQALAWANLAAHGLLLAASPHEVVRPISRTEWQQFSASKAPPELDAATLRSDILTATNIMARLPEAEERRLLLPPIPSTDKRIWYVRPPPFVAFDPLAFALSLCCDLTIAADPPEGSAWSEVDGMVRVGIRSGAQGIDPAELQREVAAANRPELPILCLVSQECAAITEGNVLLRSYPVSLADLGAWLTVVPAPARVT